MALNTYCRSFSEIRGSTQVVGRATTRDHAQPTAAVTWYLVEASARLEDGATATTRVHRRFRDFADFDETLQASLAGYASRSSLPKLPAKRPKIVQDHGSPEFLDEREKGLDAYVQRLVQVPHVWLATGAPAFVGLADAVREYRGGVEISARRGPFGLMLAALDGARRSKATEASPNARRLVLRLQKRARTHAVSF